MNDDLIAFLNSTTIVNVQCDDGLSPRGIVIAIPAGIVITLPYATYEQIRQAAGLPDIVCD